jgi:membrane fusion protein (multidrug efflux system)
MQRRLLALAIVAAVVLALAWVYVSRRPDAAAGGAPAAGPAVAMRGAPPGKGTPLSQQPVAVVTAPVVQLPLAVEIEAVGTARASESVDITAKVTNLVTSLRFDEGRLVSRGQVLVELDGAQARADLAAAEAALQESESTWKRSRDLYARQALSESQLEQIEATLKANEARVASAEARVADTVIRAPFAGRVGLRRVSVGSLISPGTVITTLDDSSVIKLDFDVPETFIAVLEPGLAVAATSIAYPGQGFTGRVISVDSRVDPVSRSVTVRAAIPNESGVLKPGMFMSVRLSREPTPALVVPESALVPERGNVYVYVVSDGVASRRAVSVGRRQPGQVELLGGVAAGDRVVVQGTQKVRDGSPVSEAPQPGAVAG